MRRAEAANRYSHGFFTSQWESALRSARLVTPVLLKLFEPQSVVDFGCGWGAWLKGFEELGVTDVSGIDGDYVDRSKLLFDALRFQPADLRQPICLDRRHDLALCLEVAEHLPKERAAGMVADLVKAAPVVMFSSAIPGQGGVGHINEQWPSYWARLFAQHAYVLVDALRPHLRNERGVEFYYRQNLVLYVDRESLSQYPALASIAEQQDDPIEEWVYAPLYHSALNALEGPMPIHRLIQEFPRASARVARRIARQLLGARSA